MNTMIAIFSSSTLNAGGPEFVVGQAASPGGGSTILMMGIIFAIFYFLLIRPQQKEHKAHMALLMGLQKGDRVVTSSGLHGRVHEVSGDVVTLEVADRVRITVDKTAVKRKIDLVATAAGSVKGG